MKHLALAVLIAACGGSAPAAPAAPVPPAPPAFVPTAFAVKVSGSGRPVIFIPGLASPGSVWDGTVAHLAGTRQVHVLTLAGFAGQPPIAPPFLLTVHDQLVHYIHANHLDHPIIVGHSLGGVLALWLAETNSAELGGIVDVEGLPFLPAVTDSTVTEAQGAAFGQQIHDRVMKAPPAQFAATLKTFLATMMTKPEDVDRITAESAKSDIETYATAIAELAGKDLRPDLSKITTKVTVIAAGSGDVPRPTLEQAWHTQIDAIKGCELHFVDDAKHFVMLDQPSAFFVQLDHALAR
ncbi:MAG: alpha/beta hydrolase [Kofleriaceae bacterium]